MKIVSTALVAVILLLSTSAIASRSYDIFVDPANGFEKGNGSIGKPFKSINDALNHVKKKYNSEKNGSTYTLQLRAGIYSEVVTKNAIKGTSEQPVTIQAYQNENVIFDGTIDISGDWKPEGNHIYSKYIGEDIWQLFVKENGQWQEKANARWPNARFGEKRGNIESVYTRESWAHANDSGNAIGLMVDDSLARDALINKVNLTGAIVVANVGSFNTWTRKITEHQKVSNSFKYEPTPSIWKKQDHFYYFIEGKKELLDSDDEWYFDKTTKTAYLYSSKGKPDQVIRAKRQPYAFNVKKWDNVTIKGVNFFGETVRCSPCENITIEDANFDYSGSSRRALGVTTSKADILYIASDKNKPDQNTYHTLRNISVSNVDGQGFFIRGDHSLVENSSFKNIDWAATETYAPSSTFVFDGNFSTLRYNTIDTTGTSETIVTTGARPVGNGQYTGPAGGVITAEYNDISNTGFAQSDGSMIQLRVAAQNGSVIQYNWLHDSVKYGIRFDAPIPAVRFGSKATTTHNVLWNTKGMMVKGIDQTVSNNMVFNRYDEKFSDLIILNNADADGVDGGGCRGCKINNNVADVISSQRAKSAAIPAWVNYSDNYNAISHGRLVSSLLKDIASNDFRPVADVTCLANKGPYQSEGEHYWIPGRRSLKTSHPIPALANRQVDVNRDLIWRPAYRGISYHVYFGQSKDKLNLAGKLTKNIFKPDPMKPGTTYYWRVDAVNSNGSIVKGDLWHFTTRAL